MDDDQTSKSALSEVILVIQRRDEQGAPTARERYAVPLATRLTLAEALLGIQERATTQSGSTTAPVRFEAPCCQGACGGCLVRVDGRARLACTTHLETFVTKKNKPIFIDAAARLKLRGDLLIDSSDLAASAQLILWSEKPTDSRHSGAGNGAPTVTPEPVSDPAPAEISETREGIEQGAAQKTPGRERVIELGRCLDCGACLDACPEYGGGNDFVGAAALMQAARANLADPDRAPERLDGMMGRGGISHCGKAENCVEVCPVAVPLVDTLGALTRATTLHFFRRWISG